MNPMKNIMLEKVTINIGAGEAGPKLETAKKLMSKLSGGKMTVTKRKKRTSFGGGKGRPIGVKVTLRGKEARAFLEDALKSIENRLPASSFDRNGNFSVGVKEYIHLPGIKYDPEIDIMGMDVCATLERKGYRIKKRRIMPKKVGKSHRIKPDEAMDWVKKEFDVDIAEKGAE